MLTDLWPLVPVSFVSSASTIDPGPKTRDSPSVVVILAEPWPVRQVSKYTFTHRYDDDELPLWSIMPIVVVGI